MSLLLKIHAKFTVSNRRLHMYVNLGGFSNLIHLSTVSNKLEKG